MILLMLSYSLNLRLHATLRDENKQKRSYMCKTYDFDTQLFLDGTLFIYLFLFVHYFKRVKHI